MPTYTSHADVRDVLAVAGGVWWRVMRCLGRCARNEEQLYRLNFGRRVTFRHSEGSSSLIGWYLSREMFVLYHRILNQDLMTILLYTP